MARTAWGLTTGGTDVDWSQARCRERPEWWEVLGVNLSEANRRAIALCGSCPVLDACGRWAAGLAFDGMIVAGEVRRQPLRVHCPGRSRG